VGACQAGATQRSAATMTRDPVARVAPGCGALNPDAGDAPRNRRVARRFVKHLEGI
jgi:hypothetical protein